MQVIVYQDIIDMVARIGHETEDRIRSPGHQNLMNLTAIGNNRATHT